MKLLVIVSSLDLKQPFSATPAWWQLMKSLYEIGVDVTATPYQGPAIEAPWWRAEPNPAQAAGDLFKFARSFWRRITPAQSAKKPRPQTNDESLSDRAVRRMAQTVIAPRWKQHVDRIFARQPDIDAVLVISVPLNHITGLARHITDQHRRPVFFYDGDVPASLPDFRGFETGFRIYQGADPSEYTAFFSNSQGGGEGLRALGARAVHTLYYGADPDLFAPLDVAQDLDVFFYGHGREYRGEWIDAMLHDASRVLAEAKFAVRGTNLGDVGRAQLLPYLSFSKLREYACRSKLNLVITRQAHASVFASSSSRPFELAALGACMVCSPYSGIETWFEPGKELVVVNSRDEAIERIGWLLRHDAERQRMGQAARERLLNEHTFRHRARQLVETIKGYQ
jgi:glycosyltransferase involved in cell wall biosynthesis